MEQERNRNGQTHPNLPQIIPQRMPTLSLRQPNVLQSLAPPGQFAINSTVPLRHLPPPPPLLKIPSPSVNVPRFDAITGPPRLQLSPGSITLPQSPIRNLHPQIDTTFNAIVPSDHIRNLLLSPTSSSVTSETSATASLSPTSVCSLPVTIPHELSRQTSTDTDASEISNAAKCKWYRERDKQKRKNLDTELELLQNRNVYLKSKNEKLTKNVSRLKECYLGLLAKRKAERQKKREAQKQSCSQTESIEATSIEPMAVVKAEVTEFDAEEIEVKEEFNAV